MLEQIFILCNKLLGSELDILVKEVDFRKLRFVGASDHFAINTSKLSRIGQC